MIANSSRSGSTSTWTCPRAIGYAGRLSTLSAICKFAHPATLAKDRSIFRWRSDLAQPNLDRNFGRLVRIARRSARHVFPSVDEQSAELRPSHRGGYRGARLAEAERQATRLLQLGQKPLGRDLGSFRLRCLKLADARLHLSMP